MFLAHSRELGAMFEKHTVQTDSPNPGTGTPFLHLRRASEIIIFKNHGQAAGTSLEHTHSQIVGTVVVPSNIRKKLEEAYRYSSDITTD